LVVIFVKTTSLLHQLSVSAAVQVMDNFCNFYLVKNMQIGNNSTTADARVKINTDLESSELQMCAEPNLKPPNFTL
jgi:hypothetical protein